MLDSIDSSTPGSRANDDEFADKPSRCCFEIKRQHNKKNNRNNQFRVPIERRGGGRTRMNDCTFTDEYMEYQYKK